MSTTDTQEAREFFEERIRVQFDHDPFTERAPGTHTIGDFIRAVLAVGDEAAARRFFDGYVAWLEAQPNRTLPALDVARANVGWCFGEGMAPERCAMWHRLTGSAHPVFGTSKPSPEEAFSAGLKAGRKARQS
jgi:hypothetical protein